MALYFSEAIENKEKDRRFCRRLSELFNESIARSRFELLENMSRSSAYTRHSWPSLFSCLIMKFIYKLNRMGLKQLPWGRLVKVERRFVEPYGDMNFRVLCENKREIRLMNIGGSWSELM